MVSRLCLAIEYSSIVWHVRRFRNAKLPLGIMVVANFVAAMVYLGVSFRFTDGYSRVYYSWYFVAGAEVVVTVATSWTWRVLSFDRTHLIRRMALLTLIILGEGVIVVCENVTVIVKNPASWSELARSNSPPETSVHPILSDTRLTLRCSAPATIGVVTAAVAMIYFVFMVYFDNLRHQHLPPVRQQVWAFLHFPVHLAMVLFMEGSTQFVIWWKILEVETDLANTLTAALETLDQKLIVTTKDLVDVLQAKVDEFTTLYPPTYTESVVAISDVIGNVSAIPDSFWAVNYTDENDPRLQPLVADLSFLWTTLDNILLAKFNIDVAQDVDESQVNPNDSASVQSTINSESWSRFNLVVSLDAPMICTCQPCTVHLLRSSIYNLSRAAS